LQVLELLRGLALTPASESDHEAKAAAAAALDAAADDAVAPLKQQHATALSNATAAARHQALMGALNARIRFSPGKPPLSAAVAAAVIDTAADELTSALADAGSIADSAAAGSNAAGLAARRLAAERVVGTASAIDSTAAALAAALGEDLAGEDEQAGELSVQLQKLSDAAAAVQDAAIKVVDVKFNKQPAKAATDDDDQESTEAAEDKAAAAVAALEEALQAAVAAVAAMPAAGDEDVTKEGVRSEIEKEVEEAVDAAEEKTKGQQETALQV
jgi:hypothetical protein